MKRVLVAFASADWQTEKIAHHVARQLEDAGLLVRLVDIGAHETEAGADDCDAVIVAGALQRGHFTPELYAFVLRHGEVLRRCNTTAFVPVSLEAASNVPDERTAIDECVRNFTADVGWAPDEICHTAGAIYERELSPMERASLHALLNPADERVKVDANAEFTDWVALNRFVHQFAARLLP